MLSRTLIYMDSNYHEEQIVLKFNFIMYVCIEVTTFRESPDR